MSTATAVPPVLVRGTPLLATKLYAPQPRGQMVPRPHLVERLRSAVRAQRLTVVSAPAGFGKTALLSQWLAERDVPAHVAWFSLDEGDNDPVRFWRYVIAALRGTGLEVGAAVLSALGSPQAPPFPSLLAGLINEIAERVAPGATPHNGELVLILDDAHTVVDSGVHQQLLFLLEHMPRAMHLILSCRANPPWPLARLRARGELCELRAADLRFSQGETAAFLNDTMALGLPESDIELLDARTEGWIAGLQMAALSMQGRQDAASFVRAFGGSHRFILDYLVEEVLGRRSGPIQDFLLRTSVLERMTASLCDAIAERSDSQAVLEQLDRDNLFLVPLDDERRWYRYHHLFGDLLRRRLAQQDPALLRALHRRASAWAEERGLHAEAIAHALRGADLDHVARLLRDNVLALMEHGELRVVEQLMSALPEDTVQSQPWLRLARAWMHAFTGNLDAAEQALDGAARPTAEEATSAERDRFAGHALAIRSGVIQAQGDQVTAIALSREALELLPEADAMARSWVTVVLGVALLWEGRPDEAEEAFADAAAISEARRDGYVAVLAHCSVAVAQLDRGLLRRAIGSFEDAIRRADEYSGRSGHPLPVVGYAHTYLADALLRRNDLPSALRHVQTGIELCTSWGEPQLLASGYIRLARVLDATGDAVGAERAMEAALAAARTFSAWYVDRVTADCVRLYLARGDVEMAYRAATAWKERFDSGSAPDYPHEMVYRALCRLSVARGEAQRALPLLERLIDLYTRAGAVDALLETLVLQAVALRACDRRTEALVPLQHALALAAPEGYVRTFLDQGPAARELLSQFVAAGGVPRADGHPAPAPESTAHVVSHAVRVLSAFAGERASPVQTSAAAPHTPAPRSPDSLVEPLSEREHEVLRLLAAGLSSTELADVLYISKNTARTHIRNIYGKLGVHKRADAILRAEGLGYL